MAIVGPIPRPDPSCPLPKRDRREMIRTRDVGRYRALNRGPIDSFRLEPEWREIR